MFGKHFTSRLSLSTLLAPDHAANWSVEKKEEKKKKRNLCTSEILETREKAAIIWGWLWAQIWYLTQTSPDLKSYLDGESGLM